MTKNGNFGQNRQNRSTSNACRIAGTHNSFRFFSLKTYIYHSWTKKTSNRMFPMAAILPINSQVTMAKWQQSLLSPDGFKPWNFFHLKRILLWSFWVVSRLKKSSVGDRDRVADRNPKSSDRDLKKKIAIENFLDCNPQADCSPNCNRLRWIAWKLINSGIFLIKKTKINNFSLF